MLFPFKLAKDYFAFLSQCHLILMEGQLLDISLVYRSPQFCAIIVADALSSLISSSFQIFSRDKVIYETTNITTKTRKLRKLHN